MANNNQIDDWQDVDDWQDLEDNRTPDAVMISQDIEPNKPGAGDTFVQNLARGATFGFADELGGHIEALGSKVGLRGLGSPYLSDIRLETPDEDQQSYSDVQKQMRDYRRGQLEIGEKESPVASFAGQMAGGLATLPAGGALLKGVANVPKLGSAAQAGANMLTSGSKTAQLLKTGAAEGGLYGLGESEAETPEGLVFDAAKGGALGGVGSAVLGKGMEAGGKAIKFLGKELGELKPSQKAVEVVSNLAFDLPPKYTEELIRNPKVMNAREFDEIEEALINTSSKIKNDLMKEGKKAWSMLDDRPAVSGDDLATVVNDNITKLKIDQSELPTDVTAMKKAQSILDTLGVTPKRSDVDEKILQEADYITKTMGVGQKLPLRELMILQKADQIRSTPAASRMLSEKDIKTIVQKLDREIDWVNPGMETSNELLKNVRMEFDSLIKGNPEYANHMATRVKPLSTSLEKLQKTLSFERSGEGLRATNTTRTVLKNLFDAQGNIKRPQTVKDLMSVKTGEDLVAPEGSATLMQDLVNEAKVRGILDRTEGGVKQGSRSVQAGGLTGGVAGSLLSPIFGFAAPAIGAAVGASAGYIKDQYGRKIGKEFIDANREKIINRDLMFQRLGEKFGDVGQKISDSSRQAVGGMNAVAIPGFVSSELGKDPEKFNEAEKRTVTKIYLMQKQNPNLSQDQIKDYMRKSIPGYQQKAAAEEFLRD